MRDWEGLPRVFVQISFVQINFFPYSSARAEPIGRSNLYPTYICNDFEPLCI